MRKGTQYILDIDNNSREFEQIIIEDSLNDLLLGVQVFQKKSL